MELLHQLNLSRKFFESGQTKGIDFRRKQLIKLRDAIVKYETEIHQALFEDLRKSAEESWVTETGFIMAEIRHALNHLARWMKPKKVKTNLLNFPSKSYIYKEPLGVVLIIGPWNYPFQLLIAPLIGALAAGNTVILKPSEFSPSTSHIIKRIIQENFPEDQVLVVEGEGSMLVPGMMKNFRFDHVFYTGSTLVGKYIYSMAAENLVPVTLELGGKSPCVIDADADIAISAKRVALTKFSNAGQMCVAPDYLLVHESIYGTFLERLKLYIEQFYGDSFHNYHYGKIINERHFGRLKKYLQEGTILFGGELDETNSLIAPTLIEPFSLETKIMQEEIFGPILPVLRFRDFEEARYIIGRNVNPLAFYIFTKDQRKAERWLESVSFGGGCVNNASWHLTNFNLPFGGRGNSGIGAYHGKYSYELFSHQKAVMKTPLWFDPSIKYPPFKGKLNLFKKIIR